MSYWTKRRKIMKNTELHMEEIKRWLNQVEHSHSTSSAKVDTSSSSRFSIFENSHFETNKEEESTTSDIENIFSDFDETLSTASNSSQQRSSETIFSAYENNHDVKMSLIDWAKEFNIFHAALKNLL